MDEINEIQDDRQKRIDSIVEDFEKAYETDNRKVREELIKDKDNFEFYKHYMEDWKREIDNRNQLKERFNFKKEEIPKEEKRYLQSIGLIDDAYFSNDRHIPLSDEAKEYMKEEKEKLDKEDEEFEKVWLKHKTETIKRQAEKDNGRNIAEQSKIIQEVYQNARDSYDFERNKKVEKINERIKEINEGRSIYKKEYNDRSLGNDKSIDKCSEGDVSQIENKKLNNIIETQENSEELMEVLKKNIDLTKEKYEVGQEVCLNSELRTFTDHSSKHSEDVAYKGLQAKASFDKYIDDNREYKEFVGEVNNERLITAAIWHDTGMNGGFDNLDDFKEWHKNQKKIYEEACRLSEEGKFEGDPKKECPENIIRAKHALNSAIHVLENRKEIEEQGINADAVALECFLHSKSASGVRDLLNEEEISKAIDKLREESDKRGVEFDYSWLVKGINEDGEYEFNEDELKSLATEASILRMGDANRDVGSKLEDMSHRGIEIDIDIDKCRTAKDIKEETQCIKEVRYGDEIVNLKPNDKGREILLGEKNIESIDMCNNEVTGRMQYEFIINNADFAPYCTIEQINERVKELDSTVYSKGNKNVDIYIICNSGDKKKFMDKLNEEEGPLSKLELEKNRKYINEINVL